MLDATVEPGENLGCLGDAPSTSPPGSVWFTIDAPADGVLFGSAYRWDFPGLGPLDTLSLAVFRADEAEPFSCAQLRLGGGRIDVRTPLEGGETYLIQAACRCDRHFNPVVQMDLGWVPPNDSLDQATSIVGLPFEDEVFLPAAGEESGEPLCEGSVVLPVPSLGRHWGTVWYRYDATATQNLVAETHQIFGGVDSVDVFEWDGSSWRSIACASPEFDDYGTTDHTRAAFPAVDGRSYLIMLGDSGQDVVSAEFRLAPA